MCVSVAACVLQCVYVHLFICVCMSDCMFLKLLKEPTSCLFFFVFLFPPPLSCLLRGLDSEFMYSLCVHVSSYGL